MTKITNLILLAVVCLFHRGASGQFTNQTLVTPKLRFELLADLPSGTPASTNRFGALDRMVYAFTAVTNQAVEFALYPRQRPFLFELRDANGRQVPKTKVGVGWTGPAEAPASSRGLDFRFSSVTPTQWSAGSFPSANDRVGDCFLMTNKGIYTLDVRVRVWSEITNRHFGFVISPPVRVEIEKR